MKVKKVLIISHDKIGTQMAGTGIRYHYMAEVLSRHFDVTVGFFGPQYLPDDAFKHSYKVQHIDVNEYQDAFTTADAVIAMWVSDAMRDFCNTNDKLLIFDIYAPVPVETLALKVFSGKKLLPEDDFSFRSSLNDYHKFLANGDAFLCSNQRQFDFWIGYTFGDGQVTPEWYLKRDIFKQLLVAPMGIDTKQELVATKQLYRGVLDGVGPNDTIIIWNGGIYDWYDGVTLIDAMAIVAKQNPAIKLIFPGTKHPNESLPKWRETIDTIKRAEEIGVKDKNVFFFENWINYHDRINFLLEADMAIYTHQPSIESEFSHRTRVLDHILAALPTVATQGDYFADVVDHEGIGIAVPPNNPEVLAQAIVKLAKTKELEAAKRNLVRIRPNYDWSVTLEPLIAYLQSSPHKVLQIDPFTPSKIHRGFLNRVRQRIPVPIKKLVLRLLPGRSRKNLLS
jgi:glycosyltransferase involved in cell wall biosynthesis